MLFRFGNFKSPVRYFCKSSEEAVVHLSSSCSLSKNIWPQAQIFFSNYFTILIILLHGAILGFIEEIQDHIM